MDLFFLADLVTVTLLLFGSLFFFAGTLGLLRFPDAHSRLHALSKVDNLGLGLICMGISLQVESMVVVFKIVVIWFFALLASGATSFLIAERKAYNDRVGRNL